MPRFVEQHIVKMNHRAFLAAARKLAKLIELDPPEGELQAFLQQHPYILSQQLTHCHHVFPQVRLGERLVTDFFCLDIPSSGMEWIGVEIERAGKRVVTKSGRKSAFLEHALQQIRDWREWIADNIDYARRSTDQSGLGLEEIQPRFYGMVIIGRKSEYTSTFDAFRKQIYRDELIHVRSWDGVAAWAEQRALLFRGVSESLLQQARAKY